MCTCHLIGDNNLVVVYSEFKGFCDIQRGFMATICGIMIECLSSQNPSKSNNSVALQSLGSPHIARPGPNSHPLWQWGTARRQLSQTQHTGMWCESFLDDLILGQSFLHCIALCLLWSITSALNTSFCLTFTLSQSKVCREREGLPQPSPLSHMPPGQMWRPFTLEVGPSHPVGTPLLRIDLITIVGGSPQIVPE